MARTAPPRPPRRRRRWLRIAAILFALGVLAAGLLLYRFRREILPESSPAGRGLALARESGCFGCHQRSSGASTGAGLAIPAILDGALPAAELREWIEEGSREGDGGGTVRMPAYGENLDREEIDDLVVYLALMQRRSATARVRPGEVLARRHGCFHCHGELGQGGVGNPGSLKGYVPGFFGGDFEVLTGGGERALVREWILAGLSESFLDSTPMPAIARGMLQGQALQMPAYREVLSAEEVELLVDFCLNLHALGPMDLAVLERYEESAPAGKATPASQESDFERSIAPILSRCLPCHGAGKQTSGYRLDTRAAALRGGELAELLEEPAIAPGESSKGLLLRFVQASEEDLDREIYPMPPKKKDRLSPAQIATLRAWIEAGAPWPQGASLR